MKTAAKSTAETAPTKTAAMETAMETAAAKATGLGSINADTGRKCDGNDGKCH
jgi:cytochrome bd-type quinol oxidase subunit 1